jgi:hypothetical protein
MPLRHEQKIQWALGRARPQAGALGREQPVSLVALPAQLTLTAPRLASPCTFYFILASFDQFLYRYRGDIALMSADSEPSEWILEGRWMGGHEGVVRTVLWDESVRSLSLCALSPAFWQCFAGWVGSFAHRGF